MFLLNSVLNSLIDLLPQNRVPWQIIWEHIGLNLEFNFWFAFHCRASQNHYYYAWVPQGKVIEAITKLTWPESFFSHGQSVNISQNIIIAGPPIMFLSMLVPYNIAVETLSAYGKIGFMICHFTSVPRNNFLYIEYQFEKYST